MATQEPNVYAGLSVVIGGLMHARPRFFAKVMGELLFWVGEDKMTFGSDYAIWEPKWQVEGFVDWDYPQATSSPTTRASASTGKKKILGLNAAELYGIEVPAEFQLPRTPARRPRRTTPSWSTKPRPGCDRAGNGAGRPGTRPGRQRHGQGHAALDTVRDPELDEPLTDAGLRGRRARCPARGSRRVQLAAADVLLRAQLRVPHGRRRLRRGERGARRAPGRGRARRPLRGRPRSTGAWRPGPASSARSATWPPASWTTCARTSCARPCWPAPTGSCRPLLSAGRSPAELAGLRLGDATGHARAGPAAGAPGRARTAGRRRRAAAGRRDHRRAGRAGRAAAAPRPGPADPGQPRGQRRRLPRDAARPLRGRAGPGRDARRQRDLHPAHSAHRRR